MCVAAVQRRSYAAAAVPLYLYPTRLPTHAMRASCASLLPPHNAHFTAARSALAHALRLRYIRATHARRVRICAAARARLTPVLPRNTVFAVLQPFSPFALISSSANLLCRHLCWPGAAAYSCSLLWPVRAFVPFTVCCMACLFSVARTHVAFCCFA